MSRTAKTASTVPTNAGVNDTSLLDDDALLTSETGVPEVDLMSEDSLARLQGKLGIDTMSSKIDYLSEIVEQALTADSAQPCKRKRAQFDPSEQIDAASDAGDVLQEIELPPSVFDVSEAQGPRVFDALAKRVNDSFTTKPLGDKLALLYDKYKTPENCEFLCVPRVNAPLWNELPHKARSGDLAMQEVQKAILKTGQALVSLAEDVLQAKKRQGTLNPEDLLETLSDALSFVGHAGYQVSLKRRYLLKPELSKGFQSLCAVSTPVTTQLFGDDLSKNVDDISKANRIATKLTNSDRGARYTKYRRSTSTVRDSFLCRGSQSRTRRNYDRISMPSRRTPYRNQPKTSAAQGLQQTH